MSAVIPAIAESTDLIFGPSGFFSEAKKDVNLEKLITSIVEYAKFRLERLEKASASDKTELDRLNATALSYSNELREIGMYPGLASYTTNASTTNQKEFGDKINEMITARRRTLESIELVKKQIAKYCDPNRAALKAELEKNITAAVMNLRKEVSGESGEVIKIRHEIEKYLINFTESWHAFKNSYQLNICLTGGAGVGKSTLARAAAVCFKAFGILASNIYKEPEPRDFIGQYVGQTTPKVFNILYGCLEGVIFIDEAYAIGQTSNYGQEFIDALVLFTQKFPGHLSIIVAGYKKDMDENFFKKNEGLNRRFPNQYELLPYPFSTINAAMLSITKNKLMITDAEASKKMDTALQFHSFFASLAYLDTSDTSSEESGELFNKQLTKYYSDFFSRFRYNLEPLIRILYLTNNIQKRDVMKAYILKHKFGIQSADLFPNQMGDVQNLVGEILKQENVYRGGTVTFMDGMNALNNYFKVRDPHQFILTEEVATGASETGGAAATETKLYTIHFCPHAQSPSNFKTNVLQPLFDPLFKKVGESFNFFDDIIEEEDVKRISDYINKLYTDAIIQLDKDFEAQSKPQSNVVKLPGSIRYAFIKQQVELLNFEIKKKKETTVVGQQVLLSYFDEKSTDVTTLVVMDGGSVTLPVRQTLDKLCAPAAAPVAAPAAPSAVAAAAITKPAFAAASPAVTKVESPNDIPIYEGYEEHPDNGIGVFLRPQGSTGDFLKFILEDNGIYLIEGKDIPPFLKVLNATKNQNCTVILTKGKGDYYYLKNEKGERLRYLNKQSTIPNIPKRSDGKIPPFSVSFDGHYYEIACDSQTPVIASTGGGSAVTTTVPVYEGYEYYSGRGIRVVLNINGKKLELEPLNDQRYGFAKASEYKDFPLEIKVKNATSTGDCTVLLKRDNMETRYYTLTKETGEKVKLGKDYSFIPEGMVLTIRASDSTPTHPPFSVAVDGSRFKVISCGATATPTLLPASAASGGGSAATSKTRKTRRFGARTYRRRRNI